MTLVIFKAGYLEGVPRFVWWHVQQLLYVMLFHFVFMFCLRSPFVFFSLYEYELLVGIKIVPEEMQCNRYDPRGGPHLEPWATDTFSSG